MSYNFNARPTWHDRRGYPPAPFPYRDAPRPIPSSTLSSNNNTTPQYQEPVYPSQQRDDIKNIRPNKHINKNNRSIQSNKGKLKIQKTKHVLQRRHAATPMLSGRTILITHSLLMALFWITLAGLIAFGLYMYVYVFDFDDSTTGDQTPTEVEQLVSRNFDGSFSLLTINGSIANFQQVFNDPNSEEFRELANDIEASLDEVYMSLENVTYVGSSVTEFRGGSIVANFILTFNTPKNYRTDFENELKTSLIDAIEGTGSTDNDFLRGGDRDTVVISEVIGTYTPPPMQETTSMTIQQPTATAEEYDPYCGNLNIKLDSENPSFQLRSYNYPDLNNNVNCTWLITSPQYTTIYIEFNDFGTLNETEFIRIADSSNSSILQSVIFEYSGDQIPAGLFKSSENVIWIEFKGNVGSRGFSMDIHYNIGCGSNVILSTIYEPVSITSLGYPDGLAVPFHCAWSVISPHETKITVAIHDFDVIFPTDWVQIGNGLNRSNSDNVIFEHSGQGVELRKYVSDSNALWVSYVSPEECGATSMTDSSDFHWPWVVALGADEDVLPSYTCMAVLTDKRWLLTTSECLENILSEKFLTATINGSTNGIEVVVDDFAFYPDSNSTFNDDLAIIRLEQNVSFSEQVRHICYPTPNTVYERCLIVGSNDSIEIDPDSVEECSDVYSTDLCIVIPESLDTTCQELNGTQLICSDEDGYWGIVGIAGNGSRCSQISDQILKFTNVSLYMEWVHSATRNWDQYDTIKVKCGKPVYELDITEQILSSPNYPSNYPLYFSCDWTVLAPENYRVLLRITDLMTQFCCDHVTLFDSDSSNIVLSGDIDSKTLVSSGNHVTITFHTNKHVTERGFSMSMVAIADNDATEYDGF
ncbi:ovochymase-like isoform X2 [Antedon mediterranea]|uniref:ovochymase-like isoform X2 n=1 Tax=Antedon mediterranea TaxID=105859 RepID=UPI003AF86272